MALTWQQMRTYILEGILKDEVGTDQRYSDTQMLAYARWACVELSFHTAQSASYTYTCDGATDQFVLPEDMIDNIENAGLVGFSNSEGVRYIPVYNLMPEVYWPTENSTTSRYCYWEWPSGRLTLGWKPALGEKIILNYFKIWTPPLQDNDLMSIPLWMEQPFAYLVSAAALEPIGTQAANVRQWNRKMDSGNPEDNPAQKQALHFIKQATRLLSKYPVQDRSNFYLITPRKPSR